MILKPQDILFLLKLVALGREPWTYNELGIKLGMSPSEVHAAAKRAVAAGLAVEEGGEVRPNIRNLEEFLLHGLRYFSVPDRGAITRGIPTLTSAPPLDEHFASSDEISVWPDPDGDIRGEAFSPIYKSALTGGAPESVKSRAVAQPPRKTNSSTNGPSFSTAISKI